MTTPLPAIPVESSPWDQALYAFLVEKGNRSGSKRTVESYSRMLWRFFERHDPGPGDPRRRPRLRPRHRALGQAAVPGHHRGPHRLSEQLLPLPHPDGAGHIEPL